MKKVIIMGAAGRDFHNFNTIFRNSVGYDVVAFTASQIPNIDNRIYPPELSGRLYPKGIPIFSEDQLTSLIYKYNVDIVVFSYSDIKHIDVMHKASKVLSTGASFMLIGQTILRSIKPLISVCAIRTGCGKSQTSRYICKVLNNLGKKVVVIRHPMPYGNLTDQAVQRFTTYKDFEKHNCTIEEREEYEPLVAQGTIVYAGVDYHKILVEAESESDVIVWDGGNNDTPFYQPDLNIVVFDPHRPGHELLYYPGETNMLAADIAIINKEDSATKHNIRNVEDNIKENSAAKIIHAESDIKIDYPKMTSPYLNGKIVIVIEDGPTLTHGGMDYGAGVIAAKRNSAKIEKVVPAMGYTNDQIKELQKTINESMAEIVLSATPINLSKLITVNKPVYDVKYEYKDNGDLKKEIVNFIKK